MIIFYCEHHPEYDPARGEPGTGCAKCTYMWVLLHFCYGCQEHKIRARKVLTARQKRDIFNYLRYVPWRLS
jgi:hypothetical protein